MTSSATGSAIYTEHWLVFLNTQATVNQFDVADEIDILWQLVQISSDANGNLVQDGAATYNWDGRNRLRSIVTLAGQITNFVYDFAGNLIQQADSGAALNLTKTFVQDMFTNIAYESASDGTSYDVLSAPSMDSHMAIIESGAGLSMGPS